MLNKEACNRMLAQFGLPPVDWDLIDAERAQRLLETDSLKATWEEIRQGRRLYFPERERAVDVLNLKVKAGSIKPPEDAAEARNWAFRKGYDFAVSISEELTFARTLWTCAAVAVIFFCMGALLAWAALRREDGVERERSAAAAQGEHGSATGGRASVHLPLR